MKKSECKEGMEVTWVRTVEKSRGAVEMKTIEATVVRLEAEGAWVRMRNNHRVFQNYGDIEPAGKGRDLREFMRAGGMEHVLPDGA